MFNEHVKSRRFGSLAALAVVALGVVTACGPAGYDPHQRVSLSLSFKNGETSRYRLSVSANVTATTTPPVTPSPGAGSNPFGSGPTNADLTAVASSRVTSVASDGSATVSVKLESLAVKMNGFSFSVGGQQAQQQTTQLKVSPNGAISSPDNWKSACRAAGASGALLPSSPISLSPTGSFSGLLPDHDVKPGDTWSATIAVAPGMPPVTLHEKLLRYESRSGHKTAVVQLDTNENLNVSTPEKSVAAPAGCAAPQSGNGPQMPPMPGAKPGAIPATHTTGSVKVSMTLWLDVDRHLVLETKGTVDSDSTTELSGAAVSKVHSAETKLHVTLDAVRL